MRATPSINGWIKEYTPEDLKLKYAHEERVVIYLSVFAILALGMFFSIIRYGKCPCI